MIRVHQRDGVCKKNYESHRALSNRTLVTSDRSQCYELLF